MRIFAFITFLAISVNVSSQLTVDVIGGAGTSDFIETGVVTDTSFHSSKLSFFVGANAKMNLFGSFYGGASLSYAAKGASYIDGTKWGYNYLDLAGNIYYNLDKLYVGIGPQVGYLINSNASLVEANYTFINLAERKIDFGINFDIQYYVTDQLLVGGNFFYGLNDVYNVHLLNDMGNSAGQYYTQNINGSLYIGYRIMGE